MRIRTLLLFTVILFGFVLAAIAASAIITGELSTRSSSQETVANSVAQGADELGYLANDYVIYGASQQISRWQARFAVFSQDIASLRPENADQRALVTSIQADAQRMNDVFNNIVVSTAPSAVQSRAVDLASLQVSWGRMSVQSQSLASDANRLARMLRSQADGLRQMNMIVILVMVAVLVGYFAVNYLLLQRRVLKSIASLQAGTDVVGSGNLNFKIEETTNDELGDLSRSFNKMTTRLNEVTSSKEELERQIEERKKAEAEVVHLASFPELNPNPTLEIDNAGNVTYGNPAALSRFPDLITKGSQHPFLADFVKTIQAGDKAPATKDIEVDGSWFERAATYVPGTQSYRLYARDITARKHAEEELRSSNRELEAFSYSVSHDLRAPLRSMEGFSSALLEDYADKLDDQGKKYLGYVQDASELMGQLIDDLLKLSRVTRVEMNREVVDLSEIAKNVAGDLEKANPDRTVEVKVAPGLSVNGDRNLLRVAIDNLIGNAWKFSGKTDSALIEIGVSEHNGKRAFFVRDNGVGFDMTYADKLFKPFQRLHKATDFPGTGIGLATVQRIIRRHGGEVWAEGKEGEGATFYFTLG